MIGASNITEENYVVVLSDSKADYENEIHLNDYTKMVQNQIVDIAKNPQLESDIEEFTISGLPATRFTFTGSINGLKITYLVTMTETDKAFYRILSWTLTSAFEKNKPELVAVSNSLEWH